MGQSDIVTKYRPDAPIVLNATFDRGDADRRRIDDQILGTQQQLVATSFSGGTRSFFQLSPAAVAPIVPGMVCCLAQNDATATSVAIATAAALSAAGGAPLAVCLQRALPGASFLGLFRGVLPPSVFSLGAGYAGPIAVDTVTGMLKRISSPTPNDFVMGTCDVNGTCVVTGSARGSTVINIATTTTVASILAVATAPGWNVIGTFPSPSTVFSMLEIVGAVSDASLTLSVRPYCLSPTFVGPVLDLTGVPVVAVLNSVIDSEAYSESFYLVAGRLYQMQAQVVGNAGDDYFGLVRRAVPIAGSLA